MIEPIKKLEEFTQLLKYMRDNALAFPTVTRIYLDNARTDELRAYTGNYICLVDASDSTASIELKFNTQEANKIKFTKGLAVRTPYYSIYITHTAQAGKWVDILWGILSPELLEVIDQRSEANTLTTLEAIREELRGDTIPENWGTERTVGDLATVEILASNADRKGFLVQAKASNTGKIYIGFDNTVLSTKWIAELQPGQSLMLDDYRGPIHAIADAAGQLLGYGEW